VVTNSQPTTAAAATCGYPRHSAPAPNIFPSAIHHQPVQLPLTWLTAVVATSNKFWLLLYQRSTTRPRLLHQLSLLLTRHHLIFHLSIVRQSSAGCCSNGLSTCRSVQLSLQLLLNYKFAHTSLHLDRRLSTSAHSSKFNLAVDLLLARLRFFLSHPLQLDGALP
jgi:hypothetical protein